ncbi:MAG: putative zinc metalloprotease [Verrucomicrobiae bacterium]|nr:putative zinc metalloprotease [Verrucomicrobiae bacterium]
MLYWTPTCGRERKPNVQFDLLNIIATKIYPAVLVVFFFGLTIFIHELGHFLVARRRKMVVERFFIGFGPRIFSWKRDGVEYGVAWIPFGGYVALPQMAPMEAIEGKTENQAEKLPAASPASKIMVAFAGPIMNIFLAVILATILWQVGLAVPVNPSVVGWIDPGSREEQLGIQVGDRIVQINDRPIKTWMEVQRAVAISREPQTTVVLERNGVRQQYELETEMNETFGVKTIGLYPRGRPVAGGFLENSPAEAAGMKVGDKFLSVEGVPVTTAQELRELIGKRPDMETEVRVMRDGKTLTLRVTPRVDPQEKVGRMGVKLDDELEYEVVQPGPTPKQQFKDVLGLMGDTVYALIHHKQTGIGAKSLSGPVGIAGGWWHEIVNGGWRRGLWFAVLLNINLAIINLLPLPVLDGGHIVFAIFEAIFRRPLNAKFVHATSVAFAVLLISFMLYVTFFDIQRLAGRWTRSNRSPATNDDASVSETNQP